MGVCIPISGHLHPGLRVNARMATLDDVDTGMSEYILAIHFEPVPLPVPIPVPRLLQALESRQSDDLDLDSTNLVQVRAQQLALGQQQV